MDAALLGLQLEDAQSGPDVLYGTDHDGMQHDGLGVDVLEGEQVVEYLGDVEHGGLHLTHHLQHLSLQQAQVSEVVLQDAESNVGDVGWRAQLVTDEANECLLGLVGLGQVSSGEGEVSGEGDDAENEVINTESIHIKGYTTDDALGEMGSDGNDGHDNDANGELDENAL